MSKYTQVIPDDIEKAIGWLLSEVRPNKKFLDVGCSTGYFGEFIKQQLHNSVDGIEISEDKELAKKVLDNVFSFDLDSPWPGEIQGQRYDYILFGDVLEHLKYPLHALQEAKKILKAGGKVFVSVPNIAHISIRLELMNGSFEYEDTGILDNTHLQYFTKDSFKALAKKAGYSIKKIDYSINDFPDKIIKKLLEKAGLSPTKDFSDIANSTEARAYQYKFVLENNKHHPDTHEEEMKLPPKPEHYRDSFIKDLESQISAIKRHADEQAAVIESQKLEIIRLQKRPNLHRKLLSPIKKYFTRH